MATTELYRVYSGELEVRTKGDGRTVFGHAVPWATPVRIDSRLTEQFRSGAFEAQHSSAHRIRLAHEHVALGGKLIGAMSLMRVDAAGQYVEARVSKTRDGDDALELVNDGALRYFSVGFREGQNRSLRVSGIGEVTERVTATMFELALTSTPAYGEGSSVHGTRSVQQALANLDEARQILAGLPMLPAAV